MPITQLSPELEALRKHAVQPGESISLCLQTTPHEALIVTSARIIIFKDRTKTTNGRDGGRYFPLASVQRLEPHDAFLGGSIVIITPDTANELRPFNLSKCSFAVTFQDRRLRDQALSLAATEIHQEQLAAIQARVRGHLAPIVIPGVFAQAGETFYFSSTTSLYAEHTYREYTGASQGISFRIMRGVYYRVGGYRGQAVNRSQMAEDDRGQINLSNRRLLFIGARKTLDLDYARITGVTPNGEEGLQINLSNKPSLHFVCPDATTYFMLDRLMTNPP
jgi:hypothetical protein